MNLAETRSHTPLVHAPKPKKPKRPIPKIGKKRLSANREYSKRRKAYLLAHPYCQIFIKVHCLDEAQIIKDKGVIWGSMGYLSHVPLATEIHHSKKPKCKYLNDESTWFAACREWHDWIENNKSESRTLGFLENN